MFRVDRVENGFVVEFDEQDTDYSYVTRRFVREEPESKFSDEVAMKNLLYSILERFGPLGSKHSERRIYIQLAPGTDHPDYKGLDHEYSE